MYSVRHWGYSNEQNVDFAFTEFISALWAKSQVFLRRLTGSEAM